MTTKIGEERLWPDEDSPQSAQAPLTENQVTIAHAIELDRLREEKRELVEALKLANDCMERYVGGMPVDGWRPAIYAARTLLARVNAKEKI